MKWVSPVGDLMRRSLTLVALARGCGSLAIGTEQGGDLVVAAVAAAVELSVGLIVVCGWWADDNVDGFCPPAA